MYGNINGLYKQHGIVGPWPCSECGERSQYTDIGTETNYVFCRNPYCGFERIIDKKNSIIKENDGTFWRFDADGAKIRIRGQ